MIWLSRYSDHIEYFEELNKLGQDTPLKDVPDLPLDVVPIWNAFISLHQQRSMGWSANPLNISDILNYFNLIGLKNIEDKNFWFEVITAVDSKWLKFVHQENKKDGRSNKTSS